MCPDIISLGELLVEIMRTNVDISHGTLGAEYKGPFPSGAPAIFIDSAARMGRSLKISTGFIGAVGNDEFGKCIVEKLKNDGVDISQIKILKGVTTGIAFNQYNSDGARKFIFAAGAAKRVTPDDIKEEYFLNIKAIHIMGSALSISKSSREACYKALKIAKGKNPGVIVSFDPNIRPEMLDLKIIRKICIPVLKETDILMPSGEEAEILAEIKDEKEACVKLLEMGPKLVVLKQGKEGCMIFKPTNSNGMKIPGFKVNQVDSTGAGDSFGGAFIVGYLAGWDLVKIALFANAVGALKVQTFGPMPDTTYKEALDLINTNEVRVK